MYQDTLNIPNDWKFSFLYFLPDRVQLLGIFSIFKRTPTELNEDELRYVIKLVQDSVEYQTESNRVYLATVMLFIGFLFSIVFILSENPLGILLGLFLIVICLYVDFLLSHNFYLINRAKKCRAELNLVKRMYKRDEENDINDSYYECEYEDLIDSLDAIEAKLAIKQGKDSTVKWEEVKKEFNL